MHALDTATVTRLLALQPNKLSVFAKLALWLGVGTVLLFWGVAYSLDLLEARLSVLSPAAKTELLQWRDEAEQLYLEGNEVGLKLFLQQLRQREQIWAGVAHVQVESFDDTDLAAKFADGFILGRSIDWKIHLYQSYNPVMDLMFLQADARLLVELPARMRPGRYWPPLKLFLQLMLPLLILLLVIFALYQHLMRPLRQLQQAAGLLQAYNFHHQQPPPLAQIDFGSRQDELTELAASFDAMAARLSQLIISQRQFIADLSHELRTPLTRLQLALDALGQQPEQGRAALLQRIDVECQRMRLLAENALTLAQLEQLAEPLPVEAELCLTELLEVLVDDAHFEYPDRRLQVQLPTQMPLAAGSALLLGQALENILRNALRFTPVGGVVTLQAHWQMTVDAKRAATVAESTLRHLGSAHFAPAPTGYWQLQIIDSGPGVPSALQHQLFQAFFRAPGQQQAGFGLGLALARRQIQACRGWVWAENQPSTAAQTGLCVTVLLPAGQTSVT